MNTHEKVSLHGDSAGPGGEEPRHGEVANESTSADTDTSGVGTHDARRADRHAGAGAADATSRGRGGSQGSDVSADETSQGAGGSQRGNMSADEGSADASPADARASGARRIDRDEESVPAEGDAAVSAASQHRSAASAEIRVPGEEDTRALGRNLAPFLRPGDLVVLSGRLGAGKTTFVQGVGEGLDVERPVTSPTFVIARVHTSRSGRVPLLHVDAYRLGGIAEIDDLDLETSAEQAVTIVEWGEGMVEDLADDRLEVVIEHLDEDERLVRLTGVGRRWNSLFRAA